MPTKTKKHHKKTGSSFINIFGAILCVALLVFGGLALYHHLNAKPETEEPEPEVAVTTETPAAEEVTPEVETTEKDIKDLIEEENQKPEVEIAENGLKIPTFDVVVRQSNGTTIISGKITNFIETDGTCTYTLTGPVTKSYAKKVLPDPKSTVCEALVIKKGELASGSWRVEVEYKSQTAGGVSEKQTFTIQ